MKKLTEEINKSKRRGCLKITAKGFFGAAAEFIFTSKERLFLKYISYFIIKGATFLQL